MTAVNIAAATSTQAQQREQSLEPGGRREGLVAPDADQRRGSGRTRPARSRRCRTASWRAPRPPRPPAAAWRASAGKLLLMQLARSGRRPSPSGCAAAACQARAAAPGRHGGAGAGGAAARVRAPRRAATRRRSGTSSVSVGLLDRPPDDVASRQDRQLQEDEQVEHRPAHRAGWYADAVRRASGTGVASKTRHPLQLGHALVDLVGASASACARCRSASTLKDASAVP